MKIVLWVSIAYIFLYAMYLNLSFAFGVKRNQKRDNRYLIILVIAMAVFGSSINPPSHGWDLYRLYQYINSLRAANYDFFDYMFNFNNLLGGGTRSGLYGYKLVCFIVSRFDSNRILPFFTLIIVYGIWSYITQDWLRKNNKTELLAPSFMLSLATMPYVYVNTGIRNGLAASLVAWALYQEFEKKGSPIITISILLFSCTVHNAVIIVIPCWMLAHFAVKMKTILLIAIGLALLEPTAQFIYAQSIPGISQAANLYLHYIRSDAYFFSYGYLVVDIIFILLVVYTFYYTNKSDDRMLYKFIFIYAIVIVAQIGHYDLVLRPMYVLAMFSGITVYNLYSFFHTRTGQALMSILIFCAWGTAVILHGPAYLLMEYL